MLRLRRRWPLLGVWAELWRLDRSRTAGFAVCVVIEALCLLGFVVLAGGLADDVVEGIGGGVGSDAAREMELRLAGLGAVLIVRSATGGVNSVLSRCLAISLEASSRSRVMASALAPDDVVHLSDEAVIGDLSAATSVGSARWGPLAGVESLSQATGSLLVGGVMVGVVGVFRWWLGALLALAWLWARRNRHRDNLANWQLLRAPSVGTRRQAYFRQLGTTRPAAKEIRGYGIVDWLVDAFHRHWEQTMITSWRQRAAERPSLLLTAAVLVAVNVVVMTEVVTAGTRAELTTGAIVVLLQAVLMARALADPGAAVEEVQVASGALHLAAVDRLKMRLGSTVEPQSPSAHVGVTEAIRFSQVSFRYPGTSFPILDGLDLTIESGRSLAIVGHNGAGKTTLIRLLAGLLAPDSGEILVDGRGLNDIPMGSWRSSLAVVSQTFGRLPLSLADNVTFGSPTAVNGERLDELARRAGLTELVASLPSGWSTPLAAGVPGGVDLSGGQWQRVAIARALAAADQSASILVLDEPAAALDVRAEAAFYDSFLELTGGMTTILITHRLASVRHVDRICVLDAGRVSETGSHEQLMALDGLYAVLYRTQADPYAVDDVDA